MAVVSNLAEIQLLAMLNSTPDYFVMVDPQLRITLINTRLKEALRRFFNFEAIEGTFLFDNYIPGDLRAFKSNVLACLKGKERTALVPIQLQETGETNWYKQYFLPIYDNQNVLLGVSIHIKDITEEQNQLIETTATKERLLQVTKATSDAVWEYDIAMDKLFWHENFYAIFGYKAQQNQDCIPWWESQIHPTDKARVSESFALACMGKTQGTWREEYRFKHYDGHYCWVLDRGYLLLKPDGSPLKMVGAMQDVTDLKEKEAEIVRKNSYISEVLRIQSHELRAPVASILGLIDLLDSELLNKEQHLLLKHLKDSSLRLDDIIQKIVATASNSDL